jgi:hypothetical protein
MNRRRIEFLAWVGILITMAIAAAYVVVKPLPSNLEQLGTSEKMAKYLIQEGGK